MPTRSRARRAAAPAIVATALLVVVAGCGEDRPDDAAWAELWAAERDAVPDAEAIVEGGEEFCGPLVGELRADLDVLFPTPTEALDAAVDAWRDHAESLVFDCPDDPDEVERRLDEIAVLAAEVDAGLAADAER